MLIKSAVFSNSAVDVLLNSLGIIPSDSQPNVAVELNTVASKCTFWIEANSFKCLPCSVMHALGNRSLNFITFTEFSEGQDFCFPRKVFPAMTSCIFWLNTDIRYFLFTGSLVDKKGKILIPGVNEAVAPVTDEELALYEKIDFDLTEYAKDVGATRLLHDAKVCFTLSLPCLEQAVCISRRQKQASVDVCVVTK